MPFMGTTTIGSSARLIMTSGDSSNINAFIGVIWNVTDAPIDISQIKFRLNQNDVPFKLKAFICDISTPVIGGDLNFTFTPSHVYSYSNEISFSGDQTHAWDTFTFPSTVHLSSNGWYGLGVAGYNTQIPTGYGFVSGAEEPGGGTDYWAGSAGSYSAPNTTLSGASGGAAEMYSGYSFYTPSNYTMVSATPGTAISDAIGGSDGGWANPAYVTGAGGGGNYSVLHVGVATGHYSDYLKATNFGFSIPGGSTINGVWVELFGGSATNGTQDYSIKLVKGGSYVGTDHSGQGWNSPSSEEHYIQYGGSTDLWGTTLTPADVNSSNFGVGIAEQYASGNDARSILSNVKMYVTYTPSGGGGSSNQQQTVLSMGA